MNTADGSPSRRARVSISLVVLRTVPPTWSTRTRTSLMISSSALFQMAWGRSWTGAQTNFLETRKSTSALAPDPSSSLTISPAVRGGRACVASTAV
jgi:hypothetical protein